MKEDTVVSKKHLNISVYIHMPAGVGLLYFFECKTVGQVELVIRSHCQDGDGDRGQRGAIISAIKLSLELRFYSHP